MSTVLLVIGILSFLIIVHELGHFLVARFFRVRVEEFGIGYPPRAFTFGRWGGTEYTLNWLPFGGFVRLFGDVGEDQHGSGSFVDKSRGIQAIILVAGVFMNAVAAWALFTGALYAGIPRVIASGEESAAAWLMVAEVLPGSPAFDAGLAPGDKIAGISGASGVAPALTPEAVTDFVRERGGEPLEITYERSGTETTVTVRPAHAVIRDAPIQPAVGIALVLVSTEPLPILQAVSQGLISTYNAFKTIAVGLGSIVKDIASGAPALQDIVGPVGLVGVVGAAADNGLGNVLALAAFISVNLVIINLLPIPALDGGRLFVLGIEAAVRRNASRLALRFLNTIGIAFVVLLMVAVTYNDIARLLA